MTQGIYRTAPDTPGLLKTLVQVISEQCVSQKNAKYMFIQLNNSLLVI